MVWKVHMIVVLYMKYKEWAKDKAGEFKAWDAKTLSVSHNCHNKRCVNPDHLHLGTQSENRLRVTNCFKGIMCPNCKTYIPWCRHQPQCLLVNTNECEECSKETITITSSSSNDDVWDSDTTPS